MLSPVSSSLPRLALPQSAINDVILHGCNGGSIKINSVSNHNVLRIFSTHYRCIRTYMYILLHLKENYKRAHDYFYVACR